MRSPNEIWEKGACRDVPNKDIFYPDRDGGKYTPAADEAKSICRGDSNRPQCPVILECLFYGLVTNDRFGIWGGLSTRERNALRRYGSLDKYTAVEHINSQYRSMIENYLEKWFEENEKGLRPKDEGVPGREEE